MSYGFIKLIIQHFRQSSSMSCIQNMCLNMLWKTPVPLFSTIGTTNGHKCVKSTYTVKSIKKCHNKDFAATVDPTLGLRSEGIFFYLCLFCRWENNTQKHFLPVHLEQKCRCDMEGGKKHPPG